jgi:hypothetical protein
VSESDVDDSRVVLARDGLSQERAEDGQSVTVRRQLGFDGSLQSS